MSVASLIFFTFSRPHSHPWLLLPKQKVIEFDKRLTLIVGHNGAGKTVRARQHHNQNTSQDERLYARTFMQRPARCRFSFTLVHDTELPRRDDECIRHLMIFCHALASGDFFCSPVCAHRCMALMKSNPSFIAFVACQSQTIIECLKYITTQSLPPGEL